jgi:phenylacetate-CoA ligase
MVMTPRTGDTYFDKLETMSDEVRRNYQNKGLGDAIALAYSKSVSAREIMDGVAVKPLDIKTTRDLERIPIIRKNDLIDLEKKRLFGGFLLIPVEDVARIFISPGPIYEPLHTESINWFAKSFWASGFRKGDIVLNTFTYHMSPAGILFHEAIRTCGATALAMGTGNSEILIRTMLDLKTTAFVGTPSYLLSVIKKAEELGYLWGTFNIRKAWFTGEMLTQSMRQTLEKDYGVDTYQAYAVSEPGGAVAYECNQKNGLHFMDEYIVEIVDPANGKQLPEGEVGEVVVTPIHNSTWGLLRFGTGDLASYVTESCLCGRTAPRLTGILGRVGDSVKVRGLFIVGKQVVEVFSQFKEITRSQVVVERAKDRDEMTFKIELNSEECDKEALSEAIARKFQSLCQLRPDRIEFVGVGSIGESAKIVTDLRKWD